MIDAQTGIACEGVPEIFPEGIDALAGMERAQSIRPALSGKATTPNYAPSWNVAPTDKLSIVRYNPKTESRAFDLMRWGLVPYWAKDLKIGFSTINAMAETVDTKPGFRDAFKRRRCLVPVEAFYEWKKLDAKNKQPYAIALAGGDIMALGCLWETWKSPAEELVRSFRIVTTTANKLCAEIHNRMPVILPPSVWPTWPARRRSMARRR